MKDKFVESVYYKSNHLSGGRIAPLYGAGSEQQGWWLIFDCPEAFSIAWEELQSMEEFFRDLDWMCEGFRYVKAWVYFEGKCQIYFAFYLDW